MSWRSRWLVGIRQIASSETTATTLRRLLGIALLAAVVAGLVVAVQLIPEWQVRRADVRPTAQEPQGKPTTRAEVVSLQNEMRKTLIQVVGGAFAIIALYFTYRRVRVAEQGHITDRYTKAVEQLGALTAENKPNIEVRLGAIYALERIALDSARDHWTIMEVLTAYVRQNAPPPSTPPTEVEKRREFRTVRGDILRNRKREKEVLAANLRQNAPTTATPSAEEKKLAIAKGPSTEVQAILTVLGRRRNRRHEKVGQDLDLRGSYLRGAALAQAHLEGANFSGAHLEEANFSEAYLEGANFKWAHLQRADFSGAHLKEANFNSALLEGADFGEAHIDAGDFQGAFLEGTKFANAHLKSAGFDSARLEGSNFTDALLERARFDRAHLKGGVFLMAHLEGAKFQDAHLERAVFWKARLEGADFLWAGLEGASFSEAHLEGASLSGAHLKEASFREAYLDGADFRQASGLEVERMKMASGWEQARFDQDFAERLRSPAKSEVDSTSEATPSQTQQEKGPNPGQAGL
jgi:uncharacterized protein YjbI with pentapeptide repeats